MVNRSHSRRRMLDNRNGGYANHEDGWRENIRRLRRQAADRPA